MVAAPRKSHQPAAILASRTQCRGRVAVCRVCANVPGLVAGDRRTAQSSDLSVAAAHRRSRLWLQHERDRDDDVERWVEKTPTNERFLGRLWADFPEAKVVHVVRAPEATMASRKRLEERSAGSWRHGRRVLGDLAESYRIAAARTASESPNRYRVVRYEDLVDEPLATMGKVADFLEIESLPILLRPTVAGIPSSPNSSFALISQGAIASDRARGTPGLPRRGGRLLPPPTAGEAAAPS